MIAGRNICFLIILICFLCFNAFAQKTKTQLQKEKQKNLEKIRETEKILTETEQEKKNSLGELNALNRRIEQQETLITSISAEISLLDLDIEENNQIIDALSEDVQKLKEEYSSMLFSAQKTSNKINRLTFLFSSKSFDHLIMRLKYMEQYSKARKEQADAINRAQAILGEQVRITEMKRLEKQGLLSEEEKENNQLTGLKSKQRIVVKSLEKEEKRLKKDIDDTRKAISTLDLLIAKIIKEEMERVAREARETREKNNRRPKEEVSDDAAFVLSQSFEQNKSRFPWPVSGFISQKFGRQRHPVLKNVEIQNDGVNIQTQQNELVKAVFDGEVRKVAFIPTLGNTIIVNHGDYFTVYIGMKDVLVKTGQKINTNQEIGHVMSNGEGIAELRFQIRKNIVALDPQLWLRN